LGEHVAEGPVDLRGAADRVRVLDNVVAFPVRAEDLAAGEEAYEVAGGGLLAGMRAQADHALGRRLGRCP